MKKVEVDAEVLRIFLKAYIDAVPAGKYLIYMDTGPVLWNAVDALQNAYDKATQETPGFVFGVQVKPKTGRNYLRAGHTAYGEAVIMATNPLVLISPDGKYVWKDVAMDSLEPLHRATSPTINLLEHAYKELTQ